MQSQYEQTELIVERVVKRMLGAMRVSVAAQDDGNTVSDGYRVLNFIGAGVAVADDPANRRMNVNIAGAPSSNATTNYYTATGSERIYTITTGPYTFPSGWETPGFSDASWTTSVDDATTIATPIDSPLSQWQGTGSTYGTGAEQQAYRHTFTLASGTITGATLLVWADNFILEVWVNGAAITGFSTSIDYTGGAPVALSIPTGLLTPGSSNLVAIRIQNANPSAPTGRMRLNWKLAVAFSGTSTGWLSADLNSDVNITSGGSYFDGPNLTLTPGTWLVLAPITIINANATATVTTVLWDGTNIINSGETTASNSWRVQHTLIGFASVSASTVYKVSAAIDTGSGGRILAATVSNGARVRATGIRALKVA